MTIINKFIKISLFVIFLFFNNKLLAQNKNLNFDFLNSSEMQYNFTNRDMLNPKAVNLIAVESILLTDKWWKNGSIEVSFWSVIESFNHRIADDEMTFSNIEESNHWLICAKLGYQHTFKQFSLFAGIRNVNVDYFITPNSSLFTNSSAGIFPTISLNYGISNYPLGAMGMHTEYITEKLSLKASVYNNLNNINELKVFKFNFNPKKYGFTTQTQIKYKNNGNIYALGSASEKLPGKKLHYSIYSLIEQHLLKLNKTQFDFIVQLGYAPKKNNYCYQYWGAGIVVNNLWLKDNLGFIVYQCKTQIQRETCAEITYQFSVNSFLTFQPTIHYIKNKTTNDVIGLFRAIFLWGN